MSVCVCVCACVCVCEGCVCEGCVKLLLRMLYRKNLLP